MRFASVLALLFVTLTTAHAQVRYDTVTTRIVGPGMTYWQIEAPAVPWTFDVLEVDLTNPYLELETVEANDRRAGGYETVSEMAARKDAPGRRVVGGVNGDFFSGAGSAVAASISNGQVVRREASGRPAIGVTDAFKAFLTTPQVQGTLITEAGSGAITRYNEARAADQIALYNPFHGTSTGTNSFGTEVRVRPVDAWGVNDTVRVVVEAVESGVGNMAIPAGGAVLSAHGASIAVLAGVEAGDTLRVVQQLTPGPERIRQLVSGRPILTRSGAPASFSSTDAFNTDRHPRTVLGFNTDTTRLYFITVDGRQTSSAGMSNFEMRTFLMTVGIGNAINVDGGGSTTMVVRGEVVNDPSGSGIERAVGNGFFAFSTAPEGGTLASIQTMPSRKRVFLGQSFAITTYGADAHYHPVDLDPSQVTYSVSPELGTITPEGVFTATMAAGTGYVYVTHGLLRDSVEVTVKTVGQVTITPEEAVTDTARAVQFAVQTRDTDGLGQTTPAALITWTTLDPAIGVVDSTGRFQGRSEGTTGVVAQFAPGVSDTALVRVEIGRGVQVLDPMDEPEGWQVVLGAGLEAEGTSLTAFADTAATNGQSFHVRYRFTASQSAIGPLTLQTDLPIFGVPDSINFTLRSDGARHRAFIELEDHAGNQFVINPSRYADDSTRYAFMPGPLTRSNFSLSSIVYPIRVTGIRLALEYKGGRENGRVYEGDLYLDDLRVTYPTRTSVAVEDAPEVPGTGFVLLGNHPNPFRGATTITYRAEHADQVRLVLYDVLGRAVATVFDGRVAPGDHTLRLDASGLPSGVYFLRSSDRAGAALKLVVLQ